VDIRHLAPFNDQCLKTKRMISVGRNKSIQLSGCFIFCSSFIHYGDLYSASSRLLLRSVPDPCMARNDTVQSRCLHAGAPPIQSHL